MPIIGWLCPACKQQVPLDHFAVTSCGLAVHPDYAQAILDDRASPRYANMATATVTSGLGCPRSRAIEESDTEPVYVNPLDYNALLIGQAWDTMMSKGRKVQLHGVLAGVPVSGEIDSLRRLGDDLLIEDWKHTGNFHYSYLKRDREKKPPEAPKLEYRIQTSLYAELYEQVHGERPTRGLVWYHFSGANKSSAPSLMPMLYNFVPLTDCLAHRPYGGDYTVEQLLHQAHRLHAEEAVTWRDLPLAGESMSFGSKEFCEYCQVYSTCMTAAKGAPF